MQDLWYKNAITYCLDIETFMDADADGIGDIVGLARRLDYLETLGVTAIWLNPFYPTPNRDNGYDISDFYGVDSRLGCLGDFVDLVLGARDRGIRIIVDLVVNHTSIDHQWFQLARSSKDSPYRDYYVWSESEPENMSEGIIFPGVQESVWTYDDCAEAWYLHRFYDHQADLNIGSPAVRGEILKIMGFWLQLGVSGFRIDAVPFLIEYKGLAEKPDRDPLLLLSEMRDFLDWREAGAIMLAEANIERELAPDYFGGREFDRDDRMHLVFDFPLNQYLWLGFVRGDARPVAEALRSRPGNCPLHAQWAIFLRNHDELSLDKLTEEERQEVFEALAPDEGMRIYNRGIRRRLAPMLDGDERRLALAHSLLFGLPGTPVMWYGDEIGMGEDLTQPERWSVRTPMQWTSRRNGGFSNCTDDLVVPVVDEGPQAFSNVNAEVQEYHPDSLLNKVRGMIRLRRSCPEIGQGIWSLIEGLPDCVLGLRYELEDRRLFVLANFSGSDVELPADALPKGRTKIELCADRTAGERVDFASLSMPSYGYLWLRPVEDE